MADILTEFEQRIAANKRDIEEQEHALAILKRTMARNSDQSGGIQIPPKKVEAINFDDLIGGAQKIKKHTLTDDVRNVVSQFGANEFTIAHIDAALNKIGVVIDAKTPRTRMSIALGKLVEEGFVVRVFEGAGNVPHRYKLNEAHDLI